MNMDPPANIKQPISTLGHIWYYRRFILNYVLIIAHMDKLLRKAERFMWSKECQASLNIIKEKLVSVPILVYPDWKKKFHVHIDASSIALGVVLAQSREGSLDNTIYIFSRKFSTIENNYTTTKREALVMVYSLQKFRHYLLGGPFKFFIDHFSLKYLVNKPMLVLGS